MSVIHDSTACLDYQNRILPDVSRTFALTIPQLPAGLRDVVGNAYLLCRIADTIEDDSALDFDSKAHLLDQFIEVLKQERNSSAFSAHVSPLLSPDTPASEQDLVINTPTVVNVTFSFTPTQQRALIRCVEVMGNGMPNFQHVSSLSGLQTLEDLDRYCYFVAGVVGEMLTELFCEHAPDIAQQRDHMMPLAVSFGQGLQMTNILKDVWQDREREICWLPRSYFQDIDGSLEDAIRARDGARVSAGINQLVGVAHFHLRRALEYTSYIPRRETGIRRFCLWAIGLAVLTLRNICRNPSFTDGNEVKVSRRALKATIITCNAAQYSNSALRALFALATRGLPQSPVDTTRRDATGTEQPETCVASEEASRASARLS